ncbi:MAG: lysozyme [Alphaproteobacteria bacterium]|nr:lysozyme [Alphaproteobacteria bacterium]
MNTEQILKQQYKDYGLAPKRIIIGGKSIIVPMDYVYGKRDFYNDFWDVNDKNFLEYKKQGKMPKKIIYKGQYFVVPLKYANSGLENSELAKIVINQAMKKYNASVWQAMLVKKLCPNKKVSFYIDRYTFACRKQMLFEHTNIISNVNWNAINEFIKPGVRLVQSAKPKLNRLKRKFVHSVAAMCIVGGGIFASDKFFDRDNEKAIPYNAKHVQNTTIKKNNVSSSKTIKWEDTKNIEAECQIKLPVDNTRMNFKQKCMGKYTDKHGNLAMLDTVYNDVNILLAMFENYRSKAYDDGWGNQTIGWGNTSYLDNYGRSLGKVKASDKISMAEAVKQKDLYILYNVVPKLAKVNHKMKREEVDAFVSAAWWMGPNILQKSSFYQQLLDNNQNCWHSLSTHSNKPGIAKRLGATRDFATGKINSEDLMKLPAGWIYNLSPSMYRSGHAAYNIKDAASRSSQYKLQAILPETVNESFRAEVNMRNVMMRTNRNNLR